MKTFVVGTQWERAPNEYPHVFVEKKKARFLVEKCAKAYIFMGKKRKTSGYSSCLDNDDDLVFYSLSTLFKSYLDICLSGPTLFG